MQQVRIDGQAGLPRQLLGEDDGMPARCVLRLDNLTVVSKSSLASRITTFPAARMADVCAALDAAIAC